MAARALEHLIKQAKRNLDPKTGNVVAQSPDTATLLGLLVNASSYIDDYWLCLIQGRNVVFTPVSELFEHTDFVHRLPVDQWWLKLRPLLRILAKHESTYETEACNVPEVVGDE